MYFIHACTVICLVVSSQENAIGALLIVLNILYVFCLQMYNVHYTEVLFASSWQYYFYTVKKEREIQNNQCANSF